ncbi:hypothetical protein J6590_057385 [Homalodisca vitripennis]|nr:hypothetical protein J6590_057385 [Homalodisca vitripennis]
MRCTSRPTGGHSRVTTTKGRRTQDSEQAYRSGPSTEPRVQFPLRHERPYPLTGSHSGPRLGENCHTDMTGLTLSLVATQDRGLVPEIWSYCRPRVGPRDLVLLQYLGDNCHTDMTGLTLSLAPEIWSYCSSTQKTGLTLSPMGTKSRDVVFESGVSVVLKGESLAMCDRVKTLGVVLDGGLTFSDRISHVPQRAIIRFKVLCRRQSCQSFTTIYLLVGTAFRDRTLAEAELQTSVIRFIFNLRQVDHISPFREAVKLLPVEAVCMLLTCCMVHKVLKSREPQYLSKKLFIRQDGRRWKSKEEVSIILAQAFAMASPNIERGRIKNLSSFFKNLKIKTALTENTYYQRIGRWSVSCVFDKDDKDRVNLHPHTG